MRYLFPLRRSDGSESPLRGVYKTVRFGVPIKPCVFGLRIKPCVFPDRLISHAFRNAYYTMRFFGRMRNTVVISIASPR